MKAASVNVVCNLRHPGGFGTHARNFVSALNRLLPVAVLDTGNDSQFDDNLSPILVEVARRQIDLNRPTIWIGPNLFVPDLPGSTKIGWVTWETTEIPQPFRIALTKFDVLWVPSTFCKQLLERALGDDGPPINVVPEGVDSSTFYPPEIPRPKRPNPFQFLSVGKWEQRKAHDIVIRAYLKAFRSQSDVELILRLTSSMKDDFRIQMELETLLQEISPDERPLVRLSPPEPFPMFAQTYRNAHAFVLATRGEAWGLPILEAIASGLPCIVTEYGGHLDFCSHENVFFVPPKKLVPVQDPVYFPPHYDWGLWAEPDVDHFAEVMRFVWEDYGYAQQRANLACRDAVAQWTWERSAHIAYEILQKVM